MKSVYTISEIRDIASPIFKNHGVKSAILLGSYAKGIADEKSDIDILVDSGLRGLAFFGLLENMSEAFRVPVDLIHRSQMESDSRIERDVRISGVQIYGN